ncbi:MAG: DUF2490 domain-containing protein [Myxococcota bacterium]|nr:DUF2490 domain-containing protein [Deltaproteobacteria bacterium]MDQ3340102.1 DUF2490 domain-containing protein [Myxococcota bacterium]
MKSALAAVVLACASPAFADAQLWVEAGAGTNITKRVEVDLGPQVRFDQDMSRFAAFLPEVNIRYRAKRWLRVGGGYRLEYERDNNDELVVRHRVSVDVRLRTELGAARVDYRAMLMEQVRHDTGDPYRAVIRNRLDVSYRAFRPWIPYAGVESFHLLGDFDELTYHKLRLSLGVLRGGREHDLEMFLRAELHADDRDPTFYIVGLGYHYQL